MTKMGLLLSVPDVLGVIYDACDNHLVLLTSKDIYETACRCGVVCHQCHKLISVFEKTLWMTDHDDDHIVPCHGYYKPITYYKQIKGIIGQYPAFLKYIQRPCVTLQYYAIQKNGLLIQHVKHPNNVLMDLAIHQDVEAIQFVEQTPQRCNDVLQKD